MEGGFISIMFTPIVLNLLNDVGSIFLVREGNQLKVIEKVHYEDILEPEIVQLSQPLVKDKMDQLLLLLNTLLLT